MNLTLESSLEAQDSQGQIPASEPLENQGLQDAEIDKTGKRQELSFEPVNAITWKLTDGRSSNAWSGNRGGGYRTTRAVAWLMGIGGGLWIVRYRNKASKPMKLPKAKACAIEMVKGIRPGRVVTIGDLNRVQLDLLEPMPTLAEVIAIETANYPPLTLAPDVILNAETSSQLQGDELTIDADGYPEIPACLRRSRY